MEINERIKDLRIQKGLSQDELALKMGYRTRSSINKIEKGLNIVPLKKLEKLAKILGTTTDYLINGNIYKHDMTLGDRIKKLRKQNKLSQEALANLIGVNVQNVYRYEKGIITDLPISRIDKLAQSLNTTTEYLINGNIYKHDMTSIGERIKYLRKNKGLTQTELGDKFGVTKTAVSNWEKNFREPNIETIDKLSKIFNVSVEYLINGNQSNNLLEPIIENLGIEIVPKIETINEVDYVSSRTIAEQLGKRHADVITQIENILENENVRSLIISSTYEVEGQNRKYKEYLLTRDGFTLYMFNIQGYNDFKIAYIKRFNEMEKELLQSVREDYYRLKHMNFKRELLDKILKCEVTPNDFKDWQHILFENDLSEKLICCEIRNKERFNARGNKIRNIILEFETVDDPMVQLAPGFEAGDLIL